MCDSCLTLFPHRQPLSCRGPFLCWERSRTPTSSGRRCEFVVRTALHQIKSDNKQFCFWLPGNRNSSRATSLPRRLTSWWKHTLRSQSALIRCCSYLKEKNMHSGLWGWNGWEGRLQRLFSFVFLSEAKEDSERPPVKRLLRRSEQLPKDPATGSQQGEGVCGQSQSQLQGVGEEPALPSARTHTHTYTKAQNAPLCLHFLLTGRTTWRQLWRDAPVC